MDQVLLAVVLVLLLLAIVWLARYAVRNPEVLHLDYWQAQLRETPDEIWARSDGTYDAAARLALQRSSGRLSSGRSQGFERVRDHHRIARILRLAFTPLQRRQPRLREEIRAHHHELVRALLQNAEAVRTVQGGQPAQERAANGPGLDFILNDIMGTFAVDGRLTQQSAAGRQQAAHETSATPRQRTEAFRDLSVQHTNDQENSHDVAVNAALRAITARLWAEQRKARPTPVPEIAAYIKEHGDELSRDPRTGRARPLLVSRDALPALERIGEGTSIAFLDMSTDAEVAGLVWDRSDHPENSAAKPAMRQAVFDALVDCWKPGMGGVPALVCTHGRASRLLGSLCLLDHDRRNWEVVKLEQIRNDVFARACEEIQKGAAVHAESLDPDMRAAALQYMAATPEAYEAAGTPSAEAAAELRAMLLVRVQTAAVEEVSAINLRVPGSFPPRALESLKKELEFAL
jgi:hypothetical protein